MPEIVDPVRIAPLPIPDAAPAPAAAEQPNCVGDFDALIASGRQRVDASGQAHTIIGVRGQRQMQQLQRSRAHWDAETQGARHGLSLADVLGAQIMTGVQNLDELAPEALGQAVSGARELRRTDIALIGNQKTSAANAQLAQELRALGAEPRVLDRSRIRSIDADWIVYTTGHGDEHLPLPQAFIARGLPNNPDLTRLSSLAHALNRPETRRVTTNKSVQMQLLREHGIGTPETIPDVVSAEQLKAAGREMAQRTVGGEQLGFPVVVKANDSYGGKGVWIVDSPEELDRFADQHFASESPKSLQVQERLPIGSSDQRFTVGRDIHGRAQLFEAHRKDGVGGISNGPRGSVYTRIPLDQVSPAFRDAAERSLDAAGLDFGGIDIPPTPDGVPRVLEVNANFGVAEADLPLPRDEHAFPRMAAWLVYGKRS